MTDTTFIEQSAAKGADFLDRKIADKTPDMILAGIKQQHETIQEAVSRLAKLHPLEYDQVREDESKKLNVRVGVLDKEITSSHP